jgi:peptide/nickel transport system substrate-binding protein
LKVSEFSQEKAKQLLADAGWVLGADGIRVAKGAKYAKDGTRLRLKYQTTSGDKLREDTQQIVLDQLKRIGIEVYIENVPSDVLFGTWASGAFRRHGQFDIIQFSPNPDIADPHSHMYQYYDSVMMPTAANKGAGANYSRWVNKDADKAIEQAGGVLDLTSRHDLYCQSAQFIANDLPVIFLYNRMNAHGYTERLQNFVGYNATSPDFGANSANWWLK